MIIQRLLSAWCALIALTFCGSALAERGERFISVAFHDVVDTPDELDSDAVTTDRLVAFFDFLRGEGWSAITLDDLARARRGQRRLPDKAILITFDDGYRSLYSRVFPLLLAYRIPVVSALVGEWLDAPPGATVQYAGKPVPRDNFIDWQQAREMQASGLVEFASHTYAQHREVPSNPQGNMTPALYTARYDPVLQTYESVEQFRQRLRDDIKRNNTLLERELGRRPRAMVWPYGRYSLEALSVIHAEGFEFALTLDDEPASTDRPLQIGRYLPTAGLTLADLVNDLRFLDRLPAAQRLIRIDTGTLWSPEPAEFDRRLGRIIEQIRTLGATAAVLDAFVADPLTGQLSAWFPNPVLPVRGDALNRIAWQIRTRAGVSPVVDTRLADLTARMPRESVIELHRHLGWQVPIDGMIVSEVIELAQQRDGSVSRAATDRWSIREARRSLDLDRLPPHVQLALAAFRAVEAFRPALSLITVSRFERSAALSNIADLRLFRAEPTEQSVNLLIKALSSAGMLSDRTLRRQVGFWFDTSPNPIPAESLRALVRSVQISGGTAIGWSAGNLFDNSGEVERIGRFFSGASFPIRY